MCPFLDPDHAVIVRCTFLPDRVCEEWLDNKKFYTNDPYEFCRKQKRFFEPTSLLEVLNQQN